MGENFLYVGFWRLDHYRGMSIRGCQNLNLQALASLIANMELVKTDSGFQSAGSREPDPVVQHIPVPGFDFNPQALASLIPTVLGRVDGVYISIRRLSRA